MINYVKEIFKINSTKYLLIISLFSIILSAFRVVITEHSMFLFMIWNLFLAFIPWFLSSLIYIKKINNKIILLFIGMIWMAFFPNAPYVLTDLIHLGKEKSAPIWYDLILLLSYGFSGLLYGFISLNFIELKLGEKIKKIYINLIIIAMIYLSCFGIYIGRFLRWNSWDLISNLDNVMFDVLNRVVNPFEHPTTWGFTILFGSLINILYFGFKSMNKINLTTAST